MTDRPAPDNRPPPPLYAAVLEMKKTQQFVFYLGCFAMITFFTSVMAYMCVSRAVTSMCALLHLISLLPGCICRYANFQKGVATMVTVMLILTVFIIGSKYCPVFVAEWLFLLSPLSTALGLRAMQRIRYKGKKYLGATKPFFPLIFFAELPSFVQTSYLSLCRVNTSRRPLRKTGRPTGHSTLTYSIPARCGGGDPHTR